MISIFNLTLEANESREVAITGEYFELRNALYPVALIELLDRSGGVVSRLENPEQSDFVRPGRYETVRVTNGPTAQTIKHFYGTGDAGSRRTSGLVRIDGTSNVSVIDGGNARTLAQQSFLGVVVAGPIAAQNAYNQIWNPAGSGKNIVLKKLSLSTATAQALDVGKNITALTTLGVAIGPKLIGSAAVSVAQVRSQTSAATLITGYMASFFVPANQLVQYEFDDPVVIMPGNGFLVAGSTVNSNLLTNFEFFEQTI